MTENAAADMTSKSSESPPAVPNPSAGSNDFAREAQQQQPGMFAEFVDFLLNNKKWWLTPIIVVLMLVGLLVVLSSTAVAPFIYTLF
ncbi:MAG: DUF5989 family protein [Planctomycetota bacterium]|nr:DUF5989 family protein [Planctomycetota bacterium]MDA1212496.1 DUF5989 family protein [Planctomycetota bacterium]